MLALKEAAMMSPVGLHWSWLPFPVSTNFSSWSQDSPDKELGVLPLSHFPPAAEQPDVMLHTKRKDTKLFVKGSHLWWCTVRMLSCLLSTWAWMFVRVWAAAAQFRKWNALQRRSSDSYFPWYRPLPHTAQRVFATSLQTRHSFKQGAMFEK